jgi:hypothetical protein
MAVMTKHNNVRLLLALALFCVMLFSSLGMAETAFADQLTNDVRQAASDCKNYSEEGHSDQIKGGITQPIIACINDIIVAIGSQFVDKVVDQLRVAVGALMTLAIAFFSIGVALGKYGLGDSKWQLFRLMFKLLFVSYFVLNLEVVAVIGLFTQASTAFANMLVEAMPGVQVVGQERSYSNPNGHLGGDTDEPLASATEIETRLEANPDPSTSDAIVCKDLEIPGGKMWCLIDDIIKRVMGYMADNAGAIVGSAVGAIALVVVATIFIGPIALWIFMAVVSTFISLFIAFAMPLYIFMLSMLAILMLTAVSPIIIPLILFDGFGSSLVEKWLNQVISYIMQPLILTAFMVFMVSIMHDVVIDVSNLYKEAEQTFNDPAKKNSFIIFSLEKAVDSAFTEESEPSGVWGWIKSQAKAAVGAVAKLAAKVVDGIVNFTIALPYLNWDLGELRKFISTLLMCVVLAYGMVQFQKQIPDISTELAGAGSSTVQNLAKSYAGGMQAAGDKAKQGAGQMMDKIASALAG